MAKVYETLKKKNDTSVEVYPNIERQNIPNGAINTAKLEDDAVTSSKINNGAVTESKLNDGAVITDKIADGNVTTDKLEDGSVTTAKIHNSAVTTNKINDDAVTSSKILNGAVTESKLADGSVNTDKIADGNITFDKLDNSLQILINTSGIKRHQITLQLRDSNNTSSSYYINLLSTNTIAPNTMNELLNLLKNSGFQFQPFVRASNDTFAYIYDFDLGNNEVTIYEDRTNSGSLSDYIYNTLVSITDNILPF